MSTEPELHLPVDLLLEIVAHSDVTTVLRCATASKILRRAILDPAFGCRLAAGFDPALLLGVSYRPIHHIHGVDASSHRVIHTPSSTQPRVRLDASSLPDSFEPLAARDGLLFFRLDYKELRVWILLPATSISLPSLGSLCPVYASMRTSFSLSHGQWGAVRMPSITDMEHQTEPFYWLGATCPAVMGRTVYLPCCRDGNWVGWDRIVAMDVDAAAGTIIELPPGRLMDMNKDTHHLLASVCGFLSLLVVERGGISMWTLVPASSAETSATWSRQLLIDKLGIQRAVGLVDITIFPFDLEGFGERSGTLIVRVGKGDLLRLDLGTKVVKRLHNEEGVFVSSVFLHEIDLVSLLQAMKYF
ncbi:unnamed protein product [Alopecurus aequalis]